MTLGVCHIDKPMFLELFLQAHTKTFNSKNIKSGFAAAGLVPLDPNRVLARLQVKVRTPSPVPVIGQPNSTLPLKTPLNIVELDRLQRQRENETSPMDRTFEKIVKGCQMAMHNAVLLHDENSRLRAENARQKRKRAQRRAFIQTGGSMTVGQGITSATVRQDAQCSQEPRLEAEVGESTMAEATEPAAGKRAPRKCSVCGSTEHNARTCPCK